MATKKIIWLREKRITDNRAQADQITFTFQLIVLIKVGKLRFKFLDGMWEGKGHKQGKFVTHK